MHIARQIWSGEIWRNEMSTWIYSKLYFPLTKAHKKIPISENALQCYYLAVSCDILIPCTRKCFTVQHLTSCNTLTQNVIMHHQYPSLPSHHFMQEANMLYGAVELKTKRKSSILDETDEFDQLRLITRLGSCQSGIQIKNDTMMFYRTIFDYLCDLFAYLHACLHHGSECFAIIDCTLYTHRPPTQEPSGAYPPRGRDDDDDFHPRWSVRDRC